MSWRFGSNITVDGGAYINLKELIRDYPENAIKLFTDEELGMIDDDLFYNC